VDRKLTTIVAMDVVGYSRLMELDEKGTLERLKDIRAKIINPAVARHAGRTVKLMGDGTLLEFASVVGALQCAVDIQNELGAQAASIGPKNSLTLRIGIHLGDVIVEDGDIYGDGVNVASRLEGIAEPGGIVLSKQVHDHIGANVPVRLVSLGEQSVKNISRPIHAYRVETSSGAASQLFCFRDFELDITRFELRQAGERIPLEPQVFDLLVFLARNHHRIVTKEEVFTAIWGNRIVSDAALSSQIKAARRAVGDDGASQHTISTVHGRGFRFIAPLANSAPPEKSAPAPAVGAKTPPPETTGAPRLSLVVLPLSNLGGDAEQEYFVDGITDSLTTDLSRLAGSFVIARNTAFTYKGKHLNMKQIGAELGVRYALEGSVQRGGNRLRINVQLIETESARHIWAERFDKPLADLFDMQDEILARLAAQLGTQLIAAEARRAELSPTPDSMDLYFQGMAWADKGVNPDHYAKAHDFFTRAAALDPDNIEALVGLGMIDSVSGVSFMTDRRAERLTAAEANLTKVLKITPEHARAHMYMGLVQISTNRADLGIAESELALRLDRNLAMAHGHIGLAKYLIGRGEETEEHISEALRLSPRDPSAYAWVAFAGIARLHLGDHEEAAKHLRRALDINRNMPSAHFYLGAALASLDRIDEARAIIVAGLALDPTFTIARYRAATSSDNPVYLAQRTDIYDGMRKAGVPEG